MSEPLVVSRYCVIPGRELHFRATASGGPGGQHVNTANTRIELTFNIAKSSALGPRQRERLVAKFGPTIRVVASERRSQLQNRELARTRLARQLEAGLKVKKSRIGTKPTRASVERRLEAKRRRSSTKAQRKFKPDE